MADKSSKTEQPTQRRIEKARKEGQFAQAKEFVSAMQFLVILGVLSMGGAAWVREFRVTMRELMALAFTPEITSQDLIHAAWQSSWRHGLPLVAAGLGIVVITLSFRLATTGFGFSLKKLIPDVERFNSLTKLRDLPKQSLPSLVQAAILMPVFLWAVYVVARDKMDAVMALPMQSVESGSAFLTGSVMELFWKAGGLFVLIGSVDLFRQLKRHKADLRMSKQEIKEEMKEMEGNPQMKGRIRRLQRDRARKQMMKEVPTATAVVVNPEHFAVAIKYSMEGMTAPRIVAKGKNYLALRIKQKAIDHQVPIIEIPPHLYRAVAEILAYIFKLMNGRTPN
jgi:flagellar biosynthesis protein FlhB